MPTAQTQSYLTQYKWLSPGFAYEHHPVTFIFISCDDAELQDTIVIDLPRKTNATLGQSTAINAVKASLLQERMCLPRTIQEVSIGTANTTACFHSLLSSSHLDLCYPWGQKTCLSASLSPLPPSRNAFGCFSYKLSLVNTKIWANSTCFIYIGQIYFLKMKWWGKESFKLAFLKQIIHHLEELSMNRDTKQTTPA